MTSRTLSLLVWRYDSRLSICSTIVIASRPFSCALHNILSIHRVGVTHRHDQRSKQPTTAMLISNYGQSCRNGRRTASDLRDEVVNQLRATVAAIFLLNANVVCVFAVDAPKCLTQTTNCACVTDQGPIDLSPLDMKNPSSPRLAIGSFC